MKPYPSYKDSGVDWIGEIPSEWGIRKVKYIFEIKKRISGELGHDVLSITQQGVKIKDITSGEGQLSMDYSKYQIVNVGDFAMNHMDLLTGYVDISKYNGVTSPDYRVFSSKDPKNVEEYFLYLFQLGYTNKIFFGFGQGSSQLGRWRFPTRQFNNFKFSFPNKEEQQQISNYLDHKTQNIGSLIEKAQQKIELLKEQRTSLINQVLTKGLNPDVKMKNSGVEWIGEIPSEWARTKISYYCEVKDGTHDTPFFVDKSDESYPLVTSNSFVKNDIDFGKCKFISKQDYQDINRRSEVVRDDILMSMIGSNIGNSVIIKTDVPFSIKNVCLFKTSASKMVLPKYLLYLIMSRHLQHQINLSQKGGGQPFLSLGELRNLVFPFSPIQEQQQIVDYLDKETTMIDSLIHKEDHRINLLKEYRQSLISEVVTGKVDVRDEVFA